MDKVAKPFYLEHMNATSKPSSWLLVLIFLAALGSGSAGGVFFAFSSFVMKALAYLPPAQGIAAMQSINLAVTNFSFAVQLFGTTLLCLFLAIWSLRNLSLAGSGSVLAGALLYLLGAIFVTFVFNVPRNDALDLVNPASPEGARMWASFIPPWTAWNHVRTAASLAASAAFTFALFQFGTRQGA